MGTARAPCSSFPGQRLAGADKCRAAVNGLELPAARKGHLQKPGGWGEPAEALGRLLAGGHGPGAGIATEPDFQ